MDSLLKTGVENNFMSTEEESPKGIVYIGRIPPGMTPGHIKSLLGRFAAVDSNLPGT